MNLKKNLLVHSYKHRLYVIILYCIYSQKDKLMEKQQKIREDLCKRSGWPAFLWFGHVTPRPFCRTAVLGGAGAGGSRGVAVVAAVVVGVAWLRATLGTVTCKGG